MKGTNKGPPAQIKRAYLFVKPYYRKKLQQALPAHVMQTKKKTGQEISVALRKKIAA